MARTLEERVVQAHSDAGIPIDVNELTYLVNEGKQEGELEKDAKAITNARTRMLTAGKITLHSVGERRLGKKAKYVCVTGCNDSRPVTAPTLEVAVPERRARNPEAESEPVTALRDRLQGTLEDFRAMMESVFEHLRYVVEIEKSMRFWADEARKSGVRWGAERRK
jgi:hypothetical protein